ncbi:MAG: tetraacyldisaccharide 4'-kinase [Desulfovibrio sp.]|uniref:tetraacyldisaccharide 4'-kinase n=1 Tax=Desulfovibrio sp. 7SRBS1 TaxID=3378064 RepID=UPI003B3C3826
MLVRAAHHLLSPLGTAYGCIMRMRERLYAKGVSKSWTPWRPPAPCVSVGNIAMGGTGKTPLTAWILQHAAQCAVTPACLTRGYRAKPPELPYRVRTDSNPAHSGDEPLLLAHACPQAHILVDPKRTRSGRYAASHLHPGLYVLDDGFQHMAVARDLNLVLLRPEDLTRDWNRVFPAGYWRESASALRRADAFCIKAEPEMFHALGGLITDHLQPFGKPVFGFHLEGRDLINLCTNKTIANLDNAPYLFAAGIAHPDQAADTATKFLGKAPEAIQSFRDHTNFNSDDLNRLTQHAEKSSAAHVVVTEKDAVKIAHHLPQKTASATFPNIWALRTQVVFSGLMFGPDGFSQFFTGWLQAAKEHFA